MDEIKHFLFPMRIYTIEAAEFLRKGCCNKMRRDEVAACYKIPERLLVEYESWDFVLKEHPQERFDYNETDLKRISFIQFMQKMEFDGAWIHEHIRRKVDGTMSAQDCCRIFRERRKEFLDRIHMLEDKISALDALCYEMKQKINR